MKKILKATVAVALLATAGAASAKPNTDYKDRVIETWCKHVPVLNRFVFDCSAYSSRGG